jgi:hypothetical protein
MRHKALKLFGGFLFFCLPGLPASMVAQTFPCEPEFVLPGPTLPAPLTPRQIQSRGTDGT